MTPDDWTKVRFFKPHEFVCKHCGKEDMQFGFMLRLDRLRMSIARPLMISSGYRCPAHNLAVSDSGISGPHTTGQAADITIRGIDAYVLVGEAMQLGFTGIGVAQRGASRYIHVDDL